MPCVVYAAKSTEDRHGSIPGQLQECRDAIEDDPRRRFIAEYSDEAYSGYNSDRGPSLNAAMQHAETLAAEHGMAELWAQHSDRLARGDGRTARHTVEVALWALKNNIEIRTLHDADTFRNLLYAVVTGERNNEDSRRKGLAIQAGVRRAAEHGKRAAPLPDGYRRVRRITGDGQVQSWVKIDPGRQPVIALVFRLALNGRSCGQIARTLNRKGQLTKPVRRTSRPGPFAIGRVYGILRNPVYAALATYKGEVLANGNWPGYITPAQHERIMRLLAHTRKTHPRPPEPYLLAGIARCGVCGHTLRALSGRRHADGTVRRRYVCAGHATIPGPEQCPAGPFDALTVEATLLESLPGLLVQDAPRSPEPTAALAELAAARTRISQAARDGNERELDRSLQTMLTLNQPSIVPALDLNRLRCWLEQEQTGRDDATRKETSRLNRELRRRFERISVRFDAATLTITAVARGAGRETAVTVDRAQLTRTTPAGSPRRLRRYGRWDRAEITGALQAWATEHGRSPTSVDWKRGGPSNPTAVTVLRAFGDWNGALSKAGLQRVRAPRHKWGKQEILDALRAWSGRYDRAPYATEWAHAAAEHPTSFTVLSRFEHRWDNALAAAGLTPAPVPSGGQHKPWPDHDITMALRAWIEEHGRLPAGFEWLRAAPDRPSKGTVVKRFGSWQAALEAAGVPPARIPSNAASGAMAQTSHDPRQPG